MEEIWKDVIGYEGLYQVSNMGRVKSLPRFDRIGRLHKGCILSQCVQRGGYLYVQLSVDGKQKPSKIHRLVAEAFIPNIEAKATVNHKNCNKHDNTVDNLEWCTNLENIAHAKLNGLLKGQSNPNEKNGRAKLTKCQVMEIRRTFIKGSSEFGTVGLGKKYGVSATQIGRIVSGDSWGIIK
jgi:hypothetical protein